MKEEIKKERLVTFDLLRGFFLCIVIIDHVGRFPAIYEVISGKTELWSSAAEGFFLISGIMLGLVRGQREINLDFKIISRKIFKRSILLYLLTIFTSISLYFLAAINISINNPSTGISIFRTPIEFLFNTLSLNYIYGREDFLKYYTIYLLISIPIIYLLRKGKWPFILFLSIIVWNLFRTTHTTAVWQVFYFTGVIVGFHYYHIQKFFNNLHLLIKKLIIRSILIIFVITFSISNIIEIYFDVFEDTFLHNSILSLKIFLDPFFERSIMPFPRLFMAFIWFSALFMIFYKFRVILVKYTGKILQLFGTNSLLVYVIHSFIVFFIEMFLIKSNNIFINFSLYTMVFTFIFCILKFKNIVINHISDLKFYSINSFLQVYEILYLTT